MAVTETLCSDGLFCFSSICKFHSFKNPLASITSLFEFYFSFRRFILLVQTKKVISLNHGDEWSLTWYLRWGIYTSIPTWTPLTKFTSSSISTEFKDTFPWNISQMITKIIPISMKMIIGYAMKWGMFSVYWEVNGK